MEQEAWDTCWQRFRKSVWGPGQKIMGQKYPLRNDQQISPLCLKMETEKQEEILFSRQPLADTLEESIKIKEIYCNWEILSCAENLDVHKTYCNKQGLTLTLDVIHSWGPFQTLSPLSLPDVFFFYHKLLSPVNRSFRSSQVHLSFLCRQK